jgi:hypothetical protein
LRGQASRDEGDPPWFGRGAIGVAERPLPRAIEANRRGRFGPETLSEKGELGLLGATRGRYGRAE